MSICSGIITVSTTELKRRQSLIKIISLLKTGKNKQTKRIPRGFIFKVFLKKKKKSIVKGKRNDEQET